MLENKPWRSDAEVLCRSESYRDRFLELFPDKHLELQQQQRVALHQHQLCMSDLYLDILQSVLEQMPATLNNIIREQLISMEKMSINAPEQDETLHLKGDQYNAYNLITNSIRNSRYTGLFFFVTGPAGTGKSFLLKGLEKFFHDSRMKILLTAPTGIAANNISGQTLHSTLAIGQSQTDGRFKSSVFQWEEERRRDLKQTRVLIIDEISMVNSELLMFVSSIFARLHGNSQPFGNIHVICFGDLMQLPPVMGQKVFKAPIWKLFHPVFLTHLQRQADDPTFFRFLNKIRFGEIDEEIEDLLSSCMANFDPSAHTYLNTSLVSLCQTAKNLNDLILATLPDAPFSVHNAVDREDGNLLTTYTSRQTFKRGTNFPEEVNCAIGAKVMFLTNGLLSKGVSNGTCGVVVGLREDGMPNVAFPVREGIRVSGNAMNI